MKAIIKQTFSGVAVALLAPLVLHAQSPQAVLPTVTCDDKLTIQACYDKADAAFDSSTKERVATTVQVAKESQLAEQAEKTTPSTMSGQSGSLLDLVASAVGGLGVDGFGSSDAGGLTFDKVFEVGAWRLALGGEVQNPTLFSPLETKLEELGLSDLEDNLEEDFGDFAAVDFRLRFGYEGTVGDQHLGRDVGRYGWFTNHYYHQATPNEPVPLATWAFGAQTAMPGFFENPTAALSMTIGQLRAKYPQQADAQIKGLIQAAHGMQASLTALGVATNQVIDLINNQPQFFIEATYKERTDLTGPPAVHGSLRYEIGLKGNVNDFLEWASHSKNADCVAPWPSTMGANNQAGPALPSLSCLEAYTAAVKQAGERANRLTIKADYDKTDAFLYALPNDAAPFTLDESETWTASLSYGRFLNDFSFLRRVGENGDEKEDRARLELEASYEDVSGDPMKQSRFVASLTISQALTDGSDLSVGAVYANRPEYLGDVDKEVSARFGLRWSGFGGGKK